MTTLPLARCPDCQIELQPQWKFCIACGLPVPAAERPNPAEAAVPSEAVAPSPAVSAQPATHAQPVIPAQPATAAQPAIPAAIRPAAGRQPIARPTGEEPRRKVNVPVIVSIALGTAGVALIIYLLVIVFGSRD
jgi:hypothetical protein